MLCYITFDNNADGDGGTGYLKKGNGLYKPLALDQIPFTNIYSLNIYNILFTPKKLHKAQ